MYKKLKYYGNMHTKDERPMSGEHQHSTSFHPLEQHGMTSVLMWKYNQQLTIRFTQTVNVNNGTVRLFEALKQSLLK